MTPHEKLEFAVRIFDGFELLYVGVLCLALAVKVKRETSFGWSLCIFFLTIGALFCYAVWGRIAAPEPPKLDPVTMAIRAILMAAATGAYATFTRRMRGRP